MCGINGWWNKIKEIDHNLFFEMRDTLTHRGPDGFGSYFSPDKKLALGHRRLAFLDLSDTGTQPLSNEDKSIWLTINGEIYNYKELRQNLIEKNHIFKTNTDSEVVIHAYEEWGTKMIDMLEGMFAFGLWDEKRNSLILARDKFGIKPLYYFLDDNQLIFGSEIKSIIKNPDIKREINFTSVCEYFSYRYIPSPNTIFENIFKIEPGHFIEFNSDLKSKSTKYYNQQISNNKVSLKKITKEIDSLLRKSVEIHIRSDVPVGSFLSGGFDSTALVKYFSEFETGFNTFTIGFENWENSEHQYAEIVSRKFKTSNHKEIIKSESLDILNTLMYYFDDPIADISIIPTYQVSKLAAKHNKAVLSGEGADELFAGYTWYQDYLWDVTKKQIRDSKKWGWNLPINKFDLESYSKAMEMGKFDNIELKKLLNEQYHKYIPKNSFDFFSRHFDKTLPPPKRFQKLDARCFMGELVLTKVDRASMANSLEVRVPFLNSQIVDKMLSLDPSVYFSKKKKKLILNNILKKSIPKSIINRKKQGFTGPDKYYMDYDYYKNILKDSTLVNSGILRKEAIQKYINDKEHWKLWKIVVLEHWFKNWGN